MPEEMGEETQGSASLQWRSEDAMQGDAVPCRNE